MKHNPLIVAIDTDELSRARELVAAVAPVCGMIKIGLTSFCAFGPDKVMWLARTYHAQVMLDLKLHDIPAQVGRAVSAVSKMSCASLLTIHAAGGVEMMYAAMDRVRFRSDNLKIVAVIVLTSEHTITPEHRHNLLAAHLAGVDGVVCPAALIAEARNYSPSWTIVTPGIRPEGASTDDHAHVATPHGAWLAGANYIVVGRPITEAPDPRRAAEKILESLA